MDSTAITTQQIHQIVCRAGYAIAAIEQTRVNRWLVTAHMPGGEPLLIVVQARRQLNASDVADAAELVSVRRLGRGVLWAYGGQFSRVAEQTAREVGQRLQLVTDLPPAPAGQQRPHSARHGLAID